MTDPTLSGPLSADKGAHAAPTLFSTETAPLAAPAGAAPTPAGPSAPRLDPPCDGPRAPEMPGPIVALTLADLAAAICGSPDPAAALRALADAGRIGLVEDPIAGLQIRVRRLPGR